MNGLGRGRVDDLGAIGTHGKVTNVSINAVLEMRDPFVGDRSHRIQSLWPTARVQGIEPLRNLDAVRSPVTITVGVGWIGAMFRDLDVVP